MDAQSVRKNYARVRNEYGNVLRLLADMPDNRLLRESVIRLEAVKYEALTSYLSLPLSERTLRF